MQIRFIILLSIISVSCFAQKSKMIKPFKSTHLKMNEPSEIVNGSSPTTFFILADKAFLYETDEQGKTIRKSDVKAYDIEGACVVADKLYVSDESMRQVYVFDKTTLKLLQIKQLQFNGGRNLAFESITFNPVTKHFLMATEKAPQIFFEYDSTFQNVSQFSIEGIKEVSALTWHNNEMWVLSDEQETVYEVSATDYSIKSKWSVPIINPEGICFDAEGNLLIVSDDMGKLFHFKNPAQ